MDTVTIFHRRLTADVRIGAGTQALGDTAAQLQGGARAHAGQRLGIGVGADKFHTFDVRLDHMLYGITATAADTHHLDNRVLAVRIH